MQVQVKRFFFFSWRLHNHKSLSLTPCPLRFPWKQAWQPHTCERLGGRMVCLLTHWVYVCEGEIAYGSGGVRASVSPSKYICVRLHSVYGCVCTLTLSCMLSCCIMCMCSLYLFSFTCAWACFMCDRSCICIRAFVCIPSYVYASKQTCRPEERLCLPSRVHTCLHK